MTETAASPLTLSRNRALAPSNSSHASQTMSNPYFSSPRITTPRQSTAKSPSPNYFGFQATESGTFLTDSPHHAKRNWSPPSSAVRSTAAASPSILPIDQNPEFEAFRKQSDGNAFNLGGMGGGFKMQQPPRPRPTRTPSRMAEKEGVYDSGKAPIASATHIHRRLPSKETLDPAAADSARSPKRVLSPGSAAQLEPVRRGSPANFHSGDEQERPHSQPRFKLPLDDLNGGASGFATVQRAETLPGISPHEPEQYMVTPQHVVTLLESGTEDILFLDLRVSTQYAKAHISNALNLCIPTTLLKRPSFNVQKLADTVKDGDQRRRFENWRNSGYIIVYDTASAQLKDAQTCLNMIKKFQSEGYGGSMRIVKGGFAEFSKTFPQYVQAGVDASQQPARAGMEFPGGPQAVPVIGGCPIPATDNAANPFFGNIRQNMDLIGGVGQIGLKHPQKATDSAEAKGYPDWLRKAADQRDQGKRVSHKFEAIERREKKRMEDALSGNVSYGSPATSRPPQRRKDSSVQIAGIEKGNKNRYNNIWPFEHSRVKLQGVPTTGCDYFNASYVKAAWSNKRYISTQAPIPATFEDFWHVIWQQDVRVIVMLTAEKEGAQVKAHNYWNQKNYGPLHLDFLSERRASLELARIHSHAKKRPQLAKRVSSRSNQPPAPLATYDGKGEKSGGDAEQPYVIVRKFTLSHERFPFEPMREITQLQYSSWPDFGAPAHPAHLLALVEQTDAVVRATNKSHGSREPEPEGERPILVHCSAGCGRTGTFCTVDSVIDMLKRQRLSRLARRESPMDLDGGGPKSPAASSPTPTRAANPPGHVATANTPRRGASPASGGGGSDDFFTSQTPVDAGEHVHEGIDGAWVQSDTVDLVEKTVEDFRRQRLSMVQSLRQYVLCYESVMEWLVGEQQQQQQQSQ